MKRSITFLCAVLIVSVSMLSSCKKDDAASAKSTLMKYTWEMTSVETDDELVKAMFDLSLALVTPTYEFKKNDVYVVKYSTFLGISDSDEGTWSISDDGTELTIDGETSPIIELTKDVLKIGASDAVMSGVSDGEDTEGYGEYNIVFESK